MSAEIFQTKEDRDGFFFRLRTLIDEYDVFTGFDESMKMMDHEDDCDLIYDEDSPKIVDGIVLIFQTKNMQGFESVSTIFPSNQSTYLSKGMVAVASELL